MKIIWLFIIGGLTGGCTTSAMELTAAGPGSLAAIDRHCRMQRTLQISREWSRYEMKRNLQVIFPNWRDGAMHWAQLECSYGRPIRKFHPR